MSLLLPVSALLAIAAPAPAQELQPAASPVPATTTAAVTTEAAPVAAADRMICKRQALTGTRFAKKICYTSAQWDARAEADRRAIEEATSRAIQRDSGRD